MTSHGQCPRGGACECPRVGAFFKLMTSRGQCPRGGGAPGVPPIQVQTPPPHLAGWLRACEAFQGESIQSYNLFIPVMMTSDG